MCPLKTMTLGTFSQRSMPAASASQYCKIIARCPGWNDRQKRPRTTSDAFAYQSSVYAAIGKTNDASPSVARSQ